MKEIRDFRCTYENSAGMNEEITNDLGLSFPQVHMNRESMVVLARAIKAHDQAPFCGLPFCHTLEAQALGADINLGNASTGPRAGKYVCSSLSDLLLLEPMDFSKGRIHEVLMTAKELTDSGETVVFEVCGPITVLSALIDPKHIFKGMRKQPELVEEIFKKIGDQLLLFVKEIKKQGVMLISYADVVGGVNILGPKMAVQMMDLFTLEFVKKLQELTDEKLTILFCPKTSLALIDTGHARYREVEVCEGQISYQEACVRMAGKISFAGQMCIKNGSYTLQNGRIKELVLIG